MYPYVALGVEPRWAEESVRAKVQRYYSYSLQRTFYRRPRDLQRAFEHVGFEAQFVAAQHPRVMNHSVLGNLSRIGPVRRMLNVGLTELRTVELLVRKPA
jgi:hypothetical protein